MSDQPVAPTHRKDLQDLRDLPRGAMLSYMQKQAPPRAPRSKRHAPAPALHPILAAFASARPLTWIWQYLSHRLGRRRKFKFYEPGDTDQGVYAMPDDGDVRIAMAGDWGTGTDEAAAVAQHMEACKPHFTLHLGDIYFVGTHTEVNENFLGVKNPHNDYAPTTWPHGSLGSFALNGNHEMYARGVGYFDLMLPKLGMKRRGRPVGQKASFFCLENAYWRIIALDTGYNSVSWPIFESIVPPACDLRPEEIDWLRDVVKPSDEDTRGVILLTHHQYYSRYDDWYVKQGEQLAAFFKRPVLWFWGHEHRLTVYREFKAAASGVSAFGRCIGHGGMPVDLPVEPAKHPACEVEFVDQRRYPSDESLTVGYNGFARLALKERWLNADYVDVHGEVIFKEIWEATPEGLVRAG